ncbi:unnamed protein product [Gongylonema pulchrum]|uniref:HintN domain-containing protein n=1 Tax=Gongylonema pulchrum TaxID=637853 RepID=A0A183CUW2_9BILA|nr:unnamed protein product [Gongylonema pulchrum]
MPNTIDGDYHQVIDGDSSVPAVPAPAEVYNQPPAPPANDYNVAPPAPVSNQIEVQPAVPAATAPSYVPYPPAAPPIVQYPPQPVPVPEPRIVPVAAQRAVPTYGGGVPYYSGYFESLQCFSGDTTVQTPNAIKRIDELEIGDRVLSIEESLVLYSPVMIFLHRSHNESAVFNKIQTDDGKEVKLTDFHLLYVTNCKASEQLRLVHAKDVRIGQCLHVAREQSNSLLPIRIANIERVAGKGIYAPLTKSGDIVVNSVLSSCHSNLVAQTLQQSFFALLRRFQSLLPAKVSALDSQTGLLPGVHYFIEILNLFLPVYTHS